MSATTESAVSARPRKILVLNEIVSILRKHIEQKDDKIDGLEHEVFRSNEKIKNLEDQLTDDHDDVWHQLKSSIGRDVCVANSANTDEYDVIDGYRLPKQQHNMSSLKISKSKEKPYHCLNREKYSSTTNSKMVSFSGKYTQDMDSTNESMSGAEFEELREKLVELEDLKSSANGSEKAESVETDVRPIHTDEERSVLDLKTDNNVIQEKLYRMNDISSENLLLHSDVADYQAELRDLRNETKELRTKCYELNEEKKQNEAEIRDLRRFVELLKSNQAADAKQDLLNKIEYYQMEHNRLLEEILRLKSRLGEISPRTSRDFSIQQSSPNKISSNFETTKHTDEDHSQFIDRSRSSHSNSLAASMASSLAAGRLIKDRSLSPSTVLSFHDLTMERYKQHLEGSLFDTFSREVMTPEVDQHSEIVEPTMERESTVDKLESMNLESSHNRNSVVSDSFGSGTLKNSSYSNETGHSTDAGEVRTPSRSSLSPQRRQSNSSKKSCYSNGSVKYPKRAFAPRSPGDLKLGHCIKFTRAGGKLNKGVVRYVGHLPEKDGIFIGVELEGFDGRTSGSFEGTKYFSCPTNKGIFTPFHKIIMAWE